MFLQLPHQGLSLKYMVYVFFLSFWYGLLAIHRLNISITSQNLHCITMCHTTLKRMFGLTLFNTRDVQYAFKSTR